MIRTFTALGVLGILCLLEAGASAQSSSLFGSSGPRAQSSTASRASSSPTTTSSAASGTTGAGSSAAGTGGAMGTGTGTSSGAFQGPQLGTTGSLSAQSVGNSTGFIGAGNGTFVGERMAGATGMSTTQRPSFGSLGAGRGGSDFNTQNQPGQGASANRTFRPQYRIGFKYTRAAADVSQRTAAVVSRFTTRNPGISGLEVVVNEAGIAEIRGTAPTDDARLLIENVVRLEPGVRSIKNLIVVTPASPPPSSP